MNQSAVRVGYSKLMGGVLLPMGLFCLVLGLIAGTISSIFIGLICSGIGIGYLVSAAAIVRDTETELKNVFGMTVKRHTYADRSLLEVREGCLYLRDGDTEKKLLGRLSISGADIAKLDAWLAGPASND